MDEADWLNQCRDCCRKIKYISQNVAWSERPNHSGWLGASSTLLGSDRVSIPNLKFKGEYQPAIGGDRITYGLMHQNQRMEWRRVFMIEVYPAHIRSHVGKDGTIHFGPHLHLGDNRLQEITREIHTKLVGANLQRWIERFKRHATIREENGRYINPPFGHDLFR